MSAQALPRSDIRPSLTLKRRIKAAPEKVWRAWTEAAQLAAWFGPGTCEYLAAEIDLRVGGRFRVAFRTDIDGRPDETHEVQGSYREIVENEKLVFSWHWITTPERVSQVTVGLRADGPDGEGGTMLTLLHEQLYDEASKTGHTRGWTATLDKLEALFA
jgi:uncharacterized protein YndB with AHSA1/START domain